MASGPRCSLQTAISIRGDVRGESAWAASRSASAPVDASKLASSEPQAPFERQRDRRRARRETRRGGLLGCCGCDCGRAALYRFPRLSYVLLLVCCGLLKGLFCSLVVTRWGLGRFDVPARLDAARGTAERAGDALDVSWCAHAPRTLAPSLPALEARVDAAATAAQRRIDAHDAALAAALSASSRCLDGVAHELDAFAEAVASSPEAPARADALACVADALLALAPAASPANETLVGLPAALEQRVRSRIAAARRSARLALHEHRLRRLAGLVNASAVSAVATMRRSVALKLDALVAMVDTPGSPRADATARALSDAEDVHDVLSGVAGAVHVLAGVDGSLRGVESLLASVDNFSRDAVAGLTLGERKSAYLSGVMGAQLRRTRSTLGGEFRDAQSSLLRVSAAVDAQVQEEIAALVAAARESADCAVSSADAGAEEGAFLGEVRASHVLHRLSRPPQPEVLASNSTRYPPLRVSPLPAPASPRRWSSRSLRNLEPSWEKQSNNATGSAEEAAGGARHKLGVLSLLMGGAASDPLPALEWYSLKVESFRMTVLLLHLTAGMLTNTLWTAPQLDARKLSGIQDIASLRDVFFGKPTVAELLVALVAHGGELLSAVMRIGITGSVSLVATLFLMTVKSEHLEVCPQFRRGFHPTGTSTTAAESSARPPTQRTWFMTEVVSTLLPAFQVNDTLRLADELDSHAASMFEALQTQVDAIWSEQAELQTWIGRFAEPAGALTAALGGCEPLGPTSELSIVHDNTKRLCRLATSSWRAVPLQLQAGAPNVSADAFTHPEPSQAQPLTFGGCPALSLEGMKSREEALERLKLRYLCAAEEVAYLWLSSWLLLAFVWGVSHLAGDLMIEATSLCWWRVLNNNRVSFVGFCSEDGRVESVDALPRAITELSREVWWEVAVRFVAGGLSVGGVVAVWFVLLS